MRLGLPQDNVKESLDLAKTIVCAYPSVWRQVGKNVREFVNDYARGQDGALSKLVKYEARTTLSGMPRNLFIQFKFSLDYLGSHVVENKRHPSQAMTHARAMLVYLDRAVVEPECEAYFVEEHFDVAQKILTFSRYLNSCADVIDAHRIDLTAPVLLNEVERRLVRDMKREVFVDYLRPVRPRHKLSNNIRVLDA